MEPSSNYPRPHAETTKHADPGSQNPGAAQPSSYTDHRGKAASCGMPNYSGGEGTGIVMPKNQPKAP